MAMSVNPRSIQDEGAFLPESIDDLIDLRERLVAAGHSEGTANGLVGWLVAKKGGGGRTPSPVTQAKYRRILRELGAGDGRTGTAQRRPDLSRSTSDDGHQVAAGQRRRRQGERKRDLMPVANEEGPDTPETPRISVM